MTEEITPTFDSLIKELDSIEKDIDKEYKYCYSPESLSSLEKIKHRVKEVKNKLSELRTIVY